MKIFRLTMSLGEKKAEIKSTDFECEMRPKTIKVIINDDFRDIRILKKEELGVINMITDNFGLILTSWTLEENIESIKKSMKDKARFHVTSRLDNALALSNQFSKLENSGTESSKSNHYINSLVDSLLEENVHPQLDSIPRNEVKELVKDGIEMSKKLENGQTVYFKSTRCFLPKGYEGVDG